MINCLCKNDEYVNNLQEEPEANKDLSRTELDAGLANHFFLLTGNQSRVIYNVHSSVMTNSTTYKQEIMKRTQ